MATYLCGDMHLPVAFYGVGMLCQQAAKLPSLKPGILQVDAIYL